MKTQTVELTEQNKAAGFSQDFGTVTRETKIAVYIVDNAGSFQRFGVYLKHGVAGGAFWRNSAPLVRCNTIEEARDVAETLFGYAGAGEFAAVVSY